MNFKRFSAIFLAGVMIAAAVPYLDRAAADTGAATSQVSETAVTVKAAANGWNKESDGFHFYYNNGTEVKNAAVNLSQDLTCAGYTFKAGVYYFNENGCLDEKVAGRQTCNVYEISKQNTVTSQKTLVVNRGGCTLSGTTYTSASSLFTGVDTDGKVYCNGELYSGYVYYNDTMYSVLSGAIGAEYTGLMTSSYVDNSAGKLADANNYYYGSGKLATAVYQNKFYKKGVFTAKSGWKKINGTIYYLKSGETITGWKYLKDYSGGKTKYKYYFNADGSLCTNLFELHPGYKKKKLMIKVNLTTHNITVLMYDNKKKSYDIPLKTWVCSTARDGKSTKVGNYHLSRSSARRWFIYKKSTPWHFYQWGVWIHGTKTWFHSTMYSAKSNKALIADGYSGYNNIGTNQTTACIRSQAVNAKLIYDIAKSQPPLPTNHIPVKIYRSKNKGPFGKVTLADTTGKIPASQNYDPTDPAFANK